MGLTDVHWAWQMYIEFICTCTPVCLHGSMFGLVCLSVVWLSRLACLSAVWKSIFDRPQYAALACGYFDTHLVVCCLKNIGLKISPRALAVSRFLEPFSQTLAKCLNRQCSVSQYWGGRLGVLEIRRSSWAHSSLFTTSVNVNRQKISKT